MKEARFFFVHYSEEVSLWWLGFVFLGSWCPEPLEDESVHLTETEAESEEGPGTRYNLQRHVFSDAASPARPHLLESPLLPQRAPPSLGPGIQRVS